MNGGRVAGNTKSKQYIAQVDEETFHVGIDGAQITLNKQARDAHLERAGGESLFSLLVGNRSYEVFVEWRKDGYDVTVDGERHHVSVSNEVAAGAAAAEAGKQRAAKVSRVGSFGGRQEPVARQVGAGAITSPMAGVLIEFLVKEGQPVKAGDGVAILEAMKTENVIRSLFDGVVRTLQATTGQTMRMDDVVLYIDVAEEK